MCILSNLITEISIEQLSDIYKEGGKVTAERIPASPCRPGRMTSSVPSRQSNSGTYHYFREAVVGKKTTSSRARAT